MAYSNQQNLYGGYYSSPLDSTAPLNRGAITFGFGSSTGTPSYEASRPSTGRHARAQASQQTGSVGVRWRAVADQPSSQGSEGVAQGSVVAGRAGAVGQTTPAAADPAASGSIPAESAFESPVAEQPSEDACEANGGAGQPQGDEEQQPQDGKEPPSQDADEQPSARDDELSASEGDDAPAAGDETQLMPEDATRLVQEGETRLTPLAETRHLASQAEPDETLLRDQGVAQAPLPVMGAGAAVEAAGSEQYDEDDEAYQALRQLQERRAQQRRSTLIKVGIAAGVVVLGLTGMLVFGAVGNKPQTDSGYETVAVERSDFEISVQGSGALQPLSQVLVTPEVNGIIDSVKATEGSYVREGDVLFTVRSTEIEKAIKDAEEALTKAQSEVDKAWEEVSKLEAQRDEARARHDSAQAAADDANARAQAAYDAAYNPLKASADAKLAAAESSYNAAKARTGIDAKAAKYEQANAAYDKAVSAREAAEKSSGKESAAYKQALQAEENARLNKESARVEYESAQNEMADPEAAWGQANSDHNAALAAAASAGENAKSKIPIPEVPVYDDASYDPSIDSARSTAETAETTRDTAQKTLDDANKQGEKRTVKAPKTGTLIAFPAVVGASVGAGNGGSDASGSSAGAASLATIADISQMRVALEVNEVDITTVKSGQRAKVTFSSIPGLEQTARVVDVASVSSGSGSSEGGSGVATFKVDLIIDKPDTRLKPGMTATVTVYTTDMPSVLVVPAAALLELSDGTYVDVVSDPSELSDSSSAAQPPKTERRKVKVAAKSSTQAVIESGVSLGETVLVGGSGAAVEGLSDEELAALATTSGSATSTVA